MSWIDVRSYLRVNDGKFVPFEDVEAFSGDCRWVPGAIVFRIGDTEVLSLELWDDINWLWPYVVQALDDCRRVGEGERFFPSQPLRFRAESLGGSGQIRLSVTGGSIENRAVGLADEIYGSVAQAVLVFFEALHRLCPPADPADARIIDTVEDWIEAEST